jgi:hypothetical protein
VSGSLIPWRERLARGLVDRATTGLARLSDEKLNELCLRFFRFRVDDAPSIVVQFNGLVVTDPGATCAVEGNERLSADLNAAFARVKAEIARRLPRTIEDRWARYRRYEARRQRLDRRRALHWLRTFAPRRTNRRGSRPRRTARASSGPPSRDGPGADDSELDPAPIGGGS